MSDITFALAFTAGLLSFVSPCVLPLLPSYVSFITGMSFDKLTSRETSLEDKKHIRFLTATNSLAFIFGFSSVFMALGASSSFVGRIMFQYQEAIRIGGGIMIIIFGLFIAGILKIDFLMKERKFHLHGKPAGYLGSFLVGVTFAVGWTPCIGPILGTILLAAASEGSMQYGLKLLGVYSLGLAIPFMLSSLTINSFLSYSKVFYRYMKGFMFVSGLVLIAFGVLLLTNRVRELSAFFPDFGINF